MQIEKTNIIKQKFSKKYIFNKLRQLKSRQIE